MELDRSKRRLAGIGLDEVEERVYVSLLRGAGRSVSELAAALGTAPARVRAALVALEDKGLVGRSGGRPTRYWPAPPATAIEMLVVRRHEELEQVRHAAKQLDEELSTLAPPASPAGLVEVLAGGDAVVNRNKQLLTGACREIMAFSAFPQTSPTAEFTAFKLALLARGVKGRVVYALDVLELPGVVEFIEAVGPAGEQARVLTELPMPLLIVDREAALLPVSAASPSVADDFLLVHRSAVLDALIMLFESTWERATPFEPGAGAGGAETGRTSDWSPSSADRRMLALLAAGMKDAAIAHQLGVGPRTVERRLARIMDRLGTRTRFQTATEATWRGWIGRPTAS